MALVLALVLPFNVLSATANIQSAVESRLTVTFTQSVTGTGSNRSISPAVQVSDSQGNLTLGTPTGTQIQVVAFTAALCATVQPTFLNAAPLPANGCWPLLAQLASSSSSNAMISIQRSFRGSLFDRYSVSDPIVTPVLRVRDSSGFEIYILDNLTSNSSQTSSGNESTSLTLAPRLGNNLPTQSHQPGDNWLVLGEHLDQVQSARIGGSPAAITLRKSGGLEIQIPSELAPGVYDLTMQSPYGLLTWVSAIRVAEPTPTRRLFSKGSGAAIGESQALALEVFRRSLHRDYQKLRCIVNASDIATSRSIAKGVCARLTKGGLREIETIVDARSTVKGSGFYIRVFANG